MLMFLVNPPCMYFTSRKTSKLGLFDPKPPSLNLTLVRIPFESIMGTRTGGKYVGAALVALPTSDMSTFDGAPGL